MAHETLSEATDRRIAALLTLLGENATIVISGARIAKEIGVSRSTVWRWITRLRKIGVRVKGHPRTGYFLEQMPDILTPETLHRQLKGSLFGKHIHHFFKIDSTNRVAFQLGESGEPEGAIVLAEEQTAGRGRAGHSWHSERATGIYVTMLLRPRIAPMQAPLLTMMAGLTAHAAIKGQANLTTDLKWPNDLLIDGKKIGGILTEMHAEPNLVRFVIVGIGLNVNQQSFPEELAHRATSLREQLGRPQSRVELLVRLLREFENDYRHFLEDGPASVVERFSKISSYARGKRVRVSDSRETFTGITAGVSAEGILQVKKDSGKIVPVIAGDVTAL